MRLESLLTDRWSSADLAFQLAARITMGRGCQEEFSVQWADISPGNFIPISAIRPPLKRYRRLDNEIEDQCYDGFRYSSSGQTTLLLNVVTSFGAHRSDTKVILRLDYFAIYSIHDRKSQLLSCSQQRTISRPEPGRRQ
jgi:hypothetical protein